VSRIYTRRGDDGSTGLFGGPRVSKDDLRVAAYGEVDELNSGLGVAREELREVSQKEIADIVDRLQSELFNLGGQLATPDAAAAPKEVPRIAKEDVDRLEHEIDRFTAELPPMPARRAQGGRALAHRNDAGSCARVPEPPLRPALRHGPGSESARRRPRGAVEGLVK
jgi:cob(I)alamin adenosyltransferase